MATVYGYVARLGPTRWTHLWARDDADADAQAARIGGVISMQRNGDQLEVPDPVREEALTQLQEAAR